jgi:hypothetical protein
MSVTGNTTRGDDRIDSSNLNGTTAHTPESLDIAKCQAEQDCQQSTVEVPHLCDLTETCAEKSDLRRREGQEELGMILSSRLDIKGMTVSVKTVAAIGRQRVERMEVHCDAAIHLPMSRG